MDCEMVFDILKKKLCTKFMITVLNFNLFAWHISFYHFRLPHLVGLGWSCPIFPKCVARVAK